MIRRGPGGESSFDAVLVGASAGSLLAAIRLAQSGLHSVIVEKSAFVGGGTAYSGGIVWAPVNHRMRAKGVADSTHDALAYLHAVDPVLTDPEAGAQYVRRLPAILEYIEEVTTLRWVTYTGLPDYFSELPGGSAGGRFLLPMTWEPSTESAAELAFVRPSLHAPGQEEDWIWGRALIGALLQAAVALGVDVWLDTPVVGLVGDAQRVRGVRVSDLEGQEVELGSRCGVLLNSGGYEWDDERTAHCMPGPRPLPQTPPSNTGDGHRLVESLGVPLVLMDHTIAIPGVRIDGTLNDGAVLHRIFFQPLAKPHSLVVNGKGERFANETFFGDVAAGMASVDGHGQPVNCPAYFVFDAQYVERYGLPQGAGHEVEVVDAATLGQLADALEIPADTLADEVLRYNDAVKRSVPDRFARGSTRYQRVFGDAQLEGNPTHGTLERGPFRAVRIVLTTSGHRGGVRLDDRGRVIGAADRPVIGLYACGNVVAGTVTGDRYFSGTSLGHALVAASAAADTMIACSEQP